MIRWKVFEEKNGLPLFLYHGVNGDRKVPLNVWVKAEYKEVVDGSGQKPYLSAFHVFKDKTALIKWLTSLKKKKNRCAVKVSTGMVKDKKSSKYSMLTGKIRLSKKEWDKRIPLEEE